MVLNPQKGGKAKPESGARASALPVGPLITSLVLAGSFAGFLFLLGRADGLVDTAFDSGGFENKAFDASEEIKAV